MRNLSNAVVSEYYVNEHCLSVDYDDDEATLVVYFDEKVCSNDEMRQKAINELVSKINELNGFEVKYDELNGRYATQVGIRRQQKGIMGSIRLNLA